MASWGQGVKMPKMVLMAIHSEGNNFNEPMAGRPGKISRAGEG